MKKLVVLFFGLLLLNTAFAQQEADVTVKDGPKIVFAETTHDFGDIEQGDKVNYTFKFTNEGTQPLILSNVLTTCGCTATDWPRDPVAPNEGGKIDVTFNSAGKMGKQNKVITVVSNAVNPQERVSIVTNVMPKGETK